MVCILTGGIATGKSILYKALLDIPYVKGFDADQVVHELYRDSEVISLLATEFGDEILSSNGLVNRSVLRAKFLESKAVKNTLEEIFHPRVQACFQSRKEALNAGECLLADIPLFFETANQFYHDKSLVVACSRETQLKRLMIRSNLDRDEALAMINQQIPIGRKINMADHVIWNEGSLESLQFQIEILVTNIFNERR